MKGWVLVPDDNPTLEGSLSSLGAFHFYPTLEGAKSFARMCGSKERPYSPMPAELTARMEVGVEEITKEEQQALPLQGSTGYDMF